MYPGILAVLTICIVVAACAPPPWREGEVEKGHKYQKIMNLLCKVRPDVPKCLRYKAQNGGNNKKDVDGKRRGGKTKTRSEEYIADIYSLLEALDDTEDAGDFTKLEDAYK